MASINTLYLLPSSLGEKDISRVTPKFNIDVIMKSKNFACENIKSARRFLIRCGLSSPIPQDINFIEIRNDEDLDGLKLAYEVLKKGEDLVYLSEAGNPCIADPGEAIVNFAHSNCIRIRPLVGASSILLALIASGFNGEQFTFHGYISRDKNERQEQIKSFIRNSQNGYTQLFMDTPYRNDQVLQDLITVAQAEQGICIAKNLCCENEQIVRSTIGELKKSGFKIGKEPCIFVIGN